MNTYSSSAIGRAAALLMAALCSLAAWTPLDAKQNLKNYGDKFQVIVPAYAFGMVAHEGNGSAIWHCAGSLSMMVASVSLLKSHVSETRPDGSRSDSFPSGHSAAAFWGATFIHRRYGIGMALLPYAMAGITAYSRVAARRHYVHDVVAGVAIGCLCVRTFSSRGSCVRISSDGKCACMVREATF
ncbi:MAG: phosphatase PAP2 family protein [Puniceicoccales bacterium]|jgi:hypothetical protein|nr:phosphatase PAP2 family protein [Puniceicoccales bacterium]